MAKCSVKKFYFGKCYVCQGDCSQEPAHEIVTKRQTQERKGSLIVQKTLVDTHRVHERCCWACHPGLAQALERVKAVV